MRDCTRSIFRRSGHRFAAENATNKKADEVLHGVRRDDAEGVDQRQRVHVAFLADLLDEVERPVDLGAREVDGEEHDLEAVVVRELGRLDRGLDGLFHRPRVASSTSLNG